MSKEIPTTNDQSAAQIRRAPVRHWLSHSFLTPYSLTHYLLLIRTAFAAALFLGFLAPLHAAQFSRGDLVRLSRSEDLQFQGRNFLSAPKGHEFTVLKHDPLSATTYVGFVKDDGSLIAISVPGDALEPVPRDGWQDLLQGMEAFREQRYDDSKRLLARAAQDETQRPLASALSTRINAAMLAPAARAALRDTAEGLCKLGHYTLALALEEGADRLGAPPSKVDRKDLAERAAISSRAVTRSRQAVALRKMIEASKQIEEGLKAEPARPELKAFQAKAQKDIEEADARHRSADKMRRFDKGAIHALTAIEQGLKACADHPKLRDLKKEMQGAFEERTSPPLTPALLAAAGVTGSTQALEEGRQLYTTRCTECHELELLDSRSIASWQQAVSGMARRAGINGAQQARIMEYLTVARNGMAAAE